MSNTSEANKIRVGVSSCLLGENVRFDSGHKKNSFINNLLSQHFELEGFCPEVSIGLGIPREAIRLVTDGETTRCVGSKTRTLDVTDELKETTDKQKSWHSQLCGYILKKDSPSCGMERVKVYKGENPRRTGVGIYAERLMENFPHLPVEEEGRLGDAKLRENFIQRVYIYSRWRSMNQQKLTLRKLQAFHASHKHIFMSHNQDKTRKLGSLLVHKTDLDLQNVAQKYLEDMTHLLKIVPTRKNHTNTLLHLQGFLKKHISTEDKQELQTNIHQYRQGTLPLIVPVTLLRHYFRQHPNPYIMNSHYMQPHPSNLMLLNQI